MTISTPQPRDPLSQGPGQLPPFALTLTEVAGGVLLRLEGEARMLTVDQMQSAFVPLVARQVPLAVLDLSGLTFLASLAMGALVAFRRDLGCWGGRVKIVGIRPEIYESLQATGLHTLFEFCATVEEACPAA